MLSSKDFEKQIWRLRFETLKIRSARALQCISILMCVDKNALPVSFHTFILIEISPRQKRFAKKVSPVRFEMSNLSWFSAVQLISILMYIDENASPVSFQALILVEMLSLCYSVDLNIDIRGRICFAYQLPSCYSDRDIIQTRAVKQLRAVRFKINLSWVSLVQCNSILMYVVKKAMPVSFQAIFLIEI